MSRLMVWALAAEVKAMTTASTERYFMTAIVAPVPWKFNAELGVSTPQPLGSQPFDVETLRGYPPPHDSTPRGPSEVAGRVASRPRARSSSAFDRSRRVRADRSA